MSSGPRPEMVDSGVVLLPRRALPFVALFLRLAVGLGLMDFGLAAIIAANRSPFGGGAMWATSGMDPLAGLAPLFALIPYVAAAAGVGLVCGIFTTVCALAACGLTLVFPLVMTLHLLLEGGMAGAGFGPMMRGFGPEMGVILIAFGVFAAPALVLLVLLSAPGVNRLSIDALIFTPRPGPIFPPEPEPGPTPTPEAETPLVPDPLATRAE